MEITRGARGVSRVSGFAVKGTVSVVLVWLSAQHQYGTLLWVVLAMAALDVLLNVHKEQLQFTKLGSAFVALGSPAIVQADLHSPQLVHVALALVAISYVQILYPQVVKWLLSLHEPKAVVKVELAALQSLEAKVEALASQQAGGSSVKIPVGIGGSSSGTNTPPGGAS